MSLKVCLSSFLMSSLTLEHMKYVFVCFMNVAKLLIGLNSGRDFGLPNFA